MASQELAKASNRYKRNYDKKTNHRSFNVGDSVLLLLPSDTNKLVSQWRGPYKVVQKSGSLDYSIDVNGKIKMFHANLLKRYINREAEDKSMTTECKGIDDGGLVDVVCSAVIVEHDAQLDPETQEGHINQNMESKDVGHLELTPTEVEETYQNVEVNQNLTWAQTEKVKRILYNFKDVLTDRPGHTQLVAHSIKLTSDEPLRVKQYPIPHAMKEVVQEEIDKMLQMKIIERSDSPYSAPIVIVKKKDGGNRFCIDYRQLNKLTVFDAEPMPSMDAIVTHLAQDHFFSKLDLSKGYWQVAVEENCKHLTAFATPSGLFQFNVMPFWLVNAPATFNRM
ncbi:hypothetical protein BSL78_14913, partial [Apostichopus japonicus]